MATPNRLLYSSQSFLASSGLHSTHLTELERVLSINHGATVTRQDVTVFGSRAPIDRIIVDAPTVSLDLSYLVTDGVNENALGLYVNPTGVGTPVGNGLLTNLLNGTRDEQNYFIKVVGPDEDAGVDNVTAASGIIGFGNASLASYSVEARLGGFATASARLAGLNLTYQTNTLTADNPAIDPSDGAPLTGVNVPTSYTIPSGGIAASYIGAVNAIRPGDIQLKLPTMFAINTVCPQSFTLTVDMTREALRCLGTKFRFANEINFPLNATLSMEVLVRDFNNNDKLTKFLCADSDEPLPLEIMLRRPPTCVGEDLPSYDPANPDARDADNFLVYSLKGARFESMTFNNGVGQGETATINYSISIGSPKDLNHNVFLYSTQTVS